MKNYSLRNIIKCIFLNALCTLVGELQKSFMLFHILCNYSFIFLPFSLWNLKKKHLSIYGIGITSNLNGIYRFG